MIKKVLTILLAISLTSCVASVNREKLERARKYADQGTRSLMSGQLDQAKAEFDLSLEIMPLPEGYDGLGCVAFYKKDYKEAEKYFIQAYEQDKSYTRALSNLALLYDALNMKQEAKNVYEFTLAKSPDDYRSRNNFAGYLYDKNKGNDSKQAKEELRKAYSSRKDAVIQGNLEKLGEKVVLKQQVPPKVAKKGENKTNGEDTSIKKVNIEDFKF